MILEIITEAVLPFIGRALVYIVMELITYGIFYFTGLAVLKLLSLGKFPDHYYWEGGRSSQDSVAIVVGLLVWVAVLLVLVVKYTG